MRAALVCLVIVLAADGPRAAPLPRLPPGFLLGVATSGYQSEGADPESNWTAFAAAHPDTIEPIGRAVDFYHRYPEDIRRAARMGLGAFRLSVEWSRIEPAPGTVDTDAIAHYRDVLTRLRRRGLEPIVTLSHFTWPQWLDDEAHAAGAASAWEWPPAVDAFARYATTVARELGDLIRYYVTLNEPNGLLSEGYVLGMFAPGIVSDPFDPNKETNLYRAFCGLMAAHAAGYAALHAADRDASVSSNVALVSFHGGLAALQDAPGLPDWTRNVFFFDALVGRPPVFKSHRTCADLGAPALPTATTVDYLSFDYYNSLDAIPNPNKPIAYWDLPIHPEGLTDALARYGARYPGLPILIAENGVATDDGRPRTDGWTREAVLVQHLARVQQAIADGIPVFGYCHWSLFDNWEWGRYSPRFGLYRVDARTDPRLVRHPTRAVRVYRVIARHRGVTRALLRRYPDPAS